MAPTLAGLLILALFITTSMVSFRSNLFGDLAVSGAARDASRVMGENLRAEIAIDSVVGDTFCSFTLVVTNPGATRVLDIGGMDLIVQFGTGNNVAQKLTYVSPGPISVGEWTDTDLTGAFEPGIFNPEESLTIDAKALLVESGTANITVGTPNGVTDTVELPAMAPCA